MADKPQIFGRKVFFLYPHSVVENELIEDIVASEYEVYIMNDHKKVVPLIQAYEKSILFINIDEQLKESEWESFIRHLTSGSLHQNVSIGILTYNDDPELARKYLMELMVPCGFIRLRLGVDESRKILLKTLEANEARGRRKYVRASTNGSKRAVFNTMINGTAEPGKIWDISVVGMAVSFDNDLALDIGTVLPDIQLKLSGILAKVSGVISAMRKEANGGYLIMFGTKINALAKSKIHSFIYKWLQDEMNRVVREL